MSGRPRPLGIGGGNPGTCHSLAKKNGHTQATGNRTLCGLPPQIFVGGELRFSLCRLARTTSQGNGLSVRTGTNLSVSRSTSQMELNHLGHSNLQKHFREPRRCKQGLSSAPWLP